MYGMDGQPTARVRKTSGTKRTWTSQEEKVLITSLKELVVRGYKCDNGFNSGYLGILENMMMYAFPGTDLRSEPHINSKIHVWKKLYASLKDMLMNGSGIGLNSATHKVEAPEDKWDAQIKKDPNARLLKNKEFPYYYDWIELFGKDRATGENAQTFPDLVQNILNNSTQQEPSVGIEQASETTPFNETSHADFQSEFLAESSSTKNKGKSKKQRVSNESDERFFEAMNLFCDKTESKFGDLTSQMSEVAQGAGSKFDSAKKREGLYDTLCRFNFMSLSLRVRVCQYFAKSPNELDMFYSFPDDAKAEMLKNIMNQI